MHKIHRIYSLLLPQILELQEELFTVHLLALNVLVKLKTNQDRNIEYKIFVVTYKKQPIAL